MWRALPIILILGACANQNFDNLGAEYLGLQYKNNPLGEAVAPDDDPLIRFDAFDCATFVETVLAGGDVKKLNKIRYANGIPNIKNRNHFIETDWIKNNSWLVQDVTREYGDVRSINVIIDKQNWFKKNYDINLDIPEKNINLEYIPYENISAIKNKKPMIILFITKSGKIKTRIGTDLAVRHMGFLMPNGVLRHASKKLGHVVDVKFSEYAKQIMENKNNLGIMLLEIKK